MVHLNIDKFEIAKEIGKISNQLQGEFFINYSDEIPNIAIFVSKQNPICVGK